MTSSNAAPVDASENLGLAPGHQWLYWPSYSTATPVARHAYLQWLANGRCDPLASIGYVFLFFYGLERRAIVDAQRHAVAKADWPAIGNELRRLLVIYGDDRSFKSHAYGLLKWVDRSIYAQQCGDKLYEQPAPPMTREPELPFHLRLALGQASRDQAPLPAEFVLEWVRLAPQIAVSKPMKRVPKMFARLFVEKYIERFGAGMVLPHSNAILKLTYRPITDFQVGREPPFVESICCYLQAAKFLRPPSKCPQVSIQPGRIPR